MALLAAVLALAAVPAHSLMPEPPARSFELHFSLGEDGSARLEPAMRFNLAGLRWRGDEHARVQVRARADGSWSRWAPLSHADGTRHGDVVVSAPVWAGDADALEVRADRQLRGLSASFENTTGTATAADRRASAVRRAAGIPGAALRRLIGAAGADAAPAAPQIRPRSSWNDGSCTPRGTPGEGQVRAAFVHHTVSLNDYEAEDSPAIVLAMCRYHVRENGWNDLGYNFVADKYGQRFEGRAGGIDRPVVGAHAQGWNTQSTGISVIGEYSAAPLPESGIDAVSRLAAWKLALHGVAPGARVTLRSAGGSENRHPAGRAVGFDTISGHRDGDRTACPGDALYAQLPEIRRRAASFGYPLDGSLRAGGGPRLEASRSAIAYRGRLTLSGSAAPGAEVRVEKEAATGWRALERLTATGDGSFSDSFRVGTTGVYRAVGPAGRSLERRVQVRPRIATLFRGAERVEGSRYRAAPGRTLRIHSRIKPMKGRVIVRAERLVAGRWRTALRRVVRTRRGRAATGFRITRPGEYRVRVISYGDRRHASGRSHLRYLEVSR